MKAEAPQRIGEKGRGGPKIPRLDFHLKPFTRLTWVSRAAEELWNPRFEAMRSAQAEITRRTVERKRVHCALVRIPPYRYLKLAESLESRGLAAVDLASGIPPGLKLLQSLFAPQPSLLFTAVGQPDIAEAIKQAWLEEDENSLLPILGWPDCCRRFHCGLLARNAWKDPTWPVAVRSLDRSAPERVAEIDYSPGANLFLRALGIRPVDHFPCSPECRESQTAFERFLEAGRKLGFGTEMGNLHEVLGWPLEWSALHGIAEIRTPFFKLATDTDATGEKLTVRRLGARPQGAPFGLLFPFAPPGFRRVSDSKGFNRGLASPLSTESAEGAFGESIVLIGPECSGKTTQAILLAEELGHPNIPIDALCWNYHREDPVFGDRLATVLKNREADAAPDDAFGPERLALARLAKEKGEAFERYWEKLRLRALGRLLSEHRFKCVIDLGSGYAAFADSDNRRQAEKLLRAYRNVFFLLPNSDFGQAADELALRCRRDRGRADRVEIERTIRQLSALRIEKQIVETQGPKEKTRDRILKLARMSNAGRPLD